MSKYNIKGNNIIIGSIGNNSRGSITITNNFSSSGTGNVIGSIGDGSRGTVTVENYNSNRVQQSTIIGNVGNGSKGNVTFTNYNCTGVQQGNGMVQVNNFASGPGAIAQVMGGKITQTFSADTYTYPENKVFFERGIPLSNPKISGQVTVEMDDETRSMYKEFL